MKNKLRMVHTENGQILVFKHVLWFRDFLFIKLSLLLQIVVFFLKPNEMSKQAALLFLPPLVMGSYDPYRKICLLEKNAGVLSFFL